VPDQPEVFQIESRVGRKKAIAVFAKKNRKFLLQAWLQ
jgi:hypothetical protein